MKASEFIEKLLDIANNYKTLYVMGCFGAPMTAENKKRYIANCDYNKKSTRTKLIKAASEDTFGFDCVCLIKGVLWGWTGDKSKVYGGAKYASNNVPDISANYMITKCSGVSNIGWDKLIPGEALWCTGHIGVYVGNGLAVECSPAWKNKVQITSVKNIAEKSGYPARKWTKHGKLPYIEYDTENKNYPPINTDTIKATNPAMSFSQNYAGSYVVTASSLNVRNGAGTSYEILTSIPKGSVVTCYGYYTSGTSYDWLYVSLVQNKTNYIGFCSSQYLRKK